MIVVYDCGNDMTHCHIVLKTWGLRMIRFDYDGGNGDYDETSWKSFAIGLRSFTLVDYSKRKETISIHNDNDNSPL